VEGRTGDVAILEAGYGVAGHPHHLHGGASSTVGSVFRVAKGAVAVIISSSGTRTYRSKRKLQHHKQNEMLAA
jgi:hypothetical protein